LILRRGIEELLDYLDGKGAVALQAKCGKSTQNVYDARFWVDSAAIDPN
jgi:hypothetical protein